MTTRSKIVSTLGIVATLTIMSLAAGGAQAGRVHGAGSSHNPIINHPPVHGPGSSHNPINNCKNHACPRPQP